MILSDFLSGQKHDNNSAQEIIPISFNMYQVLHEKYYDVRNAEHYLVQTTSPKNLVELIFQRFMV